MLNHLAWNKIMSGVYLERLQRKEGCEDGSGRAHGISRVDHELFIVEA